MASNSFGTLFRILTWGASHDRQIGVVIDGCPAGLELSEEDINRELKRRAPGQSPYTSPRKEPDCAQILSGLFEGKTTGGPISIVIPNKDADSKPYEAMKQWLRPGHANFTYLEKYGLCDHRGGGRASGRETACRVAAGAVAKKLLQTLGIQCTAFLQQIGDVRVDTFDAKQLEHSALFCPDGGAESRMVALLEQLQAEGDSVGGVVQFVATGVPVGLGDPVYEKLEANLAKAMLSLPATKGFEIGSGFQAASLRGSVHNDPFTVEAGRVVTTSNHAGGTLGGISTGMPIEGRVVFKPASSIKAAQQTVDLEGKKAVFQLPEKSRHDPCVAIRAVPVVEAMVALVLADAILMNRSAKL